MKGTVRFIKVKPGQLFTTTEEGGLFLKIVEEHIYNTLVIKPVENVEPDEAIPSFELTAWTPNEIVIVVGDLNDT